MRHKINQVQSPYEIGNFVRRKMVLPTVILSRQPDVFFFAGSIPFDCTEPSTTGTPQIPPNRKSKTYGSEQDAIDAALACGVRFLQGVDCRKIVWGE